jgi:spermidine synthase
VPTRFLTPAVFRSAMVFGKGMLAARHSGINTVMHPVLLDLYLSEGWLVD